MGCYWLGWGEMLVVVKIWVGLQWGYSVCVMCFANQNGMPPMSPYMAALVAAADSALRGLARTRRQQKGANSNCTCCCGSTDVQPSQYVVRKLLLQAVAEPLRLDPHSV